MITAAQLDYLTEVLGAVPRAARAVPAKVAANAVEAIVLTDPLNEEESALLGKILSSVGIGGHLHLQAVPLPLQSDRSPA